MNQSFNVDDNDVVGYFDGATTFDITTLSIKGLFVTLSINDTQHNTI